MERNVPKAVEFLVEKNSAELRLYVKEEVDKSRLRAIAAFASVAGLVAFLSSLGVYQLLKSYIDHSVERILQDESTRRASTRIQERSTQADGLLDRIRAADQEAGDRLDKIRRAVGSMGVYRVGSGRTNPADWQAHQDGITVSVDTSSSGFSTVPIYLVTLAGSSDAWAVTGVTSIYDATPSHFKVFIRWPIGIPRMASLSPEWARQQQWSIQWVGLEPVVMKEKP
jgi:hypothetical protein